MFSYLNYVYGFITREDATAASFTSRANPFSLKLSRRGAGAEGPAPRQRGWASFPVLVSLPAPVTGAITGFVAHGVAFCCESTAVTSRRPRTQAACQSQCLV